MERDRGNPKPAEMAPEPLRIQIIGAHPDDADIKAGGTAAKWCALGHTVRLVSLTDGRAGHHVSPGPELARRRRIEAEAAATSIGAVYEVLDLPDGTLDDRLENRHRVIRLIRGFHPDLVITHRSTDYHPDHRFAGLLVQDASYLLTVPAVCPDVPHLPTTPVILYFSDAFKKPCRFEPHVAVDIELEFDRLVGMLHCHQSQFYEWLPYNAGYLDQVPSGDAERREWLFGRVGRRIRPLANRFRELLVRIYGPESGQQIRYVEAFEVSEFGAPLDSEAWARLFPFLPAGSAALSPFSRKEWVDIPEDE
jgi:LmbE family N-acetylglucosaminyl deacetylase